MFTRCATSFLRFTFLPSRLWTLGDTIPTTLCLGSRSSFSRTPASTNLLRCCPETVIFTMSYTLVAILKAILSSARSASISSSS